MLNTNKIKAKLRERIRRKLRERIRRKLLKLEIIAHYGGKCSCPGCNESIIEFLSLDHINNDGAEERQRIGVSGSGFYNWVKKNKFPDNLRLLCHNCNLGREINGGICPHEEERLNNEKI